MVVESVHASTRATTSANKTIPTGRSGVSPAICGANVTDSLQRLLQLLLLQLLVLLLLLMS